MRKIIFSFNIAVLLFAGCNHSHDDNGHSHTVVRNNNGSMVVAGDNDHDHEDDAVSLLLTSYSDSWEIFAEADPLVVGVTSAVLAHFTNLTDFKPLEEGKVTLTLVTGETSVRQTIERPLRPGIYSFNILPVKEGTAMMIFEIETGGMTDTVQISDLRIFDDEHRAYHAAADQLPAVPGTVSFTKEQSWLIGFATGRIASQPFGTILKTVGVVLPAQGDEVILTARANGIVTLNGVGLYEGVSVKPGQHLLNIMGGSLAEGNTILRYQQAMNNFERARSDYERTSKLAAERIVSERELLLARNEYDNARAVFENQQENFSEGGQVVSAPFEGYLRDIHVSGGQYVEAGQPLVTVSRNGDLVIRAEVQQRHAHLLGSIQTANIVSGNQAWTLEQLGGSVVSSARNVSERNHLLAVHLQMPPDPGFLPGSLLDVYLTAGTGNQVLIVPNTSLIEEQGNYFVYVQVHPESFQKRQVQTGGNDGLYTEITSGLSEDERIVTRGAIIIKAATAMGTLDAHSGHVH